MILAPMLRSPQLGDPGYQRVRILGSICALRTPNKSLHWMFFVVYRYVYLIEMGICSQMKLGKQNPLHQYDREVRFCFIFFRYSKKFSMGPGCLCRSIHRKIHETFY